MGCPSSPPRPGSPSSKYPPASQLFPWQVRFTGAGVHGPGTTGTQHSPHEDAWTDGKSQGTPSDTQDVSSIPPRVSAGFCAPTALTARERNFSEQVSGCSSHGFGPRLKEAAARKRPACVPQPRTPNPGVLSPERAGHKPGGSGDVPTHPALTAGPVGSPGGRLICGATRDGSSRQKLCRSCPAGHRHGHSAEPPARLGAPEKR